MNTRYLLLSRFRVKYTRLPSLGSKQLKFEFRFVVNTYCKHILQVRFFSLYAVRIHSAESVSNCEPSLFGRFLTFLRILWTCPRECLFSTQILRNYAIEIRRSPTPALVCTAYVMHGSITFRKNFGEYLSNISKISLLNDLLYRLSTYLLPRQFRQLNTLQS